MINNEITEKAGLLADAIARSSELAELRRSEDAMAADESAQQLIAELQKAQERFMEQESKSEPSEADKNVVDEIEKKVEGNPAIVAYMTAQDKFTEMLDSVNAILAGAIAGSLGGGCSCEDDSCDSGGCDTGGCGSGGCSC